MNNQLNIRSSLIIIFGLILLSSCMMVKPVTISGVENFKAANTLTEPELQFDIGIKNPNGFGVTISKMNLKLFNGPTDLVGVEMLKKSKIPRHQSVNLPVSMKPSVNAINALLKSEVNNLVRGKITQQLELRGEIIMRKFIFTKKIKMQEPVRL